MLLRNEVLCIMAEASLLILHEQQRVTVTSMNIGMLSSLVK